MKLPSLCIVCGKEFENAFEHPSVQNQPCGAVTFKGYGHFGSTVFDPMDGTYLEVNICDECLVHKAEEGSVLHGGEPRVAPKPLKFWKPEP